MKLETIIKNLSKFAKSKILKVLTENSNFDVLTQDSDSTLCLYKKEEDFYYDRKLGYWRNSIPIPIHTIGKTYTLAGDYDKAIISRERVLELLQETNEYKHITELLPSDFYVTVDSDFNEELFLDVLESMNIVWISKHSLKDFKPTYTAKNYRVSNRLLSYGSIDQPHKGRDMTKLFSKLPERWFVVLDDIDIDKFDNYFKKKGDITFYDNTGLRESLKSKSSRSFLVKYNAKAYPYTLIFSSDPEGENITHLFLKDSCQSSSTYDVINDMSNVLIIGDKEYVKSDTSIEPGDILTTHKKTKAYTFIAMDGSNYIVKTSKGGLLSIDNPIKLVPSNVLHYAAIELEDGSVMLTGVHYSKHSLDSLLKSQTKYLKYKKVTSFTYERG